MSLKRILIESITFDITEDDAGLWNIKIKENGSVKGDAEIEQFYDYNWDLEDIMTRDEFNKYFPSGRYLSIRDINVETLERGKGYGKKLMEKIIQFAKKEGVDTLHLNAYAKTGRRALSQDDLVEFYKKFGFEVIKQGRRNSVMIKKL